MKRLLLRGALFLAAMALYGLVGNVDLESAEVTAAIVKERDAQVATERLVFDPTRPPRIYDCPGRQWIAWRDDGGPWVHDCVAVNLQP